MRLELECRNVKLVACDQTWLDSARQSDSESKRLVDLRKVNEIETLPSLDWLKDKGVQRVSIPVTAESWSEQDVDTLRREFARGDSPVVVMSAQGKRAVLMVLQHVARAEQWTLEAALEHSPEIAADPVFRQLLSEYLERHRR